MTRYFYVTWMCRGDAGTLFTRAQHHPLHPTTYDALRTQLARAATVAAGGELVRPAEVLILDAMELEAEVAAAQFPKDFPTGIVDTEQRRLALYRLPDGTLARYDAGKNWLIDPPFGELPQGARPATYAEMNAAYTETRTIQGVLKENAPQGDKEP